MENKESLVNTLIGKPEVQLSLTTKTIVLFFIALFVSSAAIILTYGMVTKK